MYKYKAKSGKKQQEQTDSSGFSSDGRNLEEPDNILSAIAEDTEDAAGISGVVVGRIVDVKNSRPVVDFDCNPYEHPLPAKSVPAIDSSHTGREAALMFEQGLAYKPVIMGFMHVPTDKDAQAAKKTTEVITAENKLHIKCGRASIVLKKDGDIVINGRELVSRASENNIIRGGTIHLN
ncbi:MAG: DUF6484 domain-containing protein [Desulfobacterales bacterium]